MYLAYKVPILFILQLDNLVYAISLSSLRQLNPRIINLLRVGSINLIFYYGVPCYDFCLAYKDTPHKRHDVETAMTQDPVITIHIAMLETIL